MSAFADALERVLVHEGGFVHHKLDPGGATNRGVIQRVYDGYRERKGQPKRSVKEITDFEVKEIYDRQYWQAIKGDKLPLGVSYVVFDGAVNSGPGQSIKWLQRALGITADGAIGEVTLAAVKNHPDHLKLISDICDRRMAFLRALKTFNTFGTGWTRRVNGVERDARAMLDGAVNAQPAAFSAGGNGKALPGDAKAPPSSAVADAAAGGGAGMSVALASIKDQLEPYTTASRYIEIAVIGLIVLGGLITVGSVVYRFWAARKRAQLADALSVRP